MKHLIKFFALPILAALLTAGCEKKEEPLNRPEYTIKTPAAVATFDADNAYRQIEKQVSFGPRNPGSQGHAAALEYLAGEMRKYADTVELQSFTLPGYNEQLNLTNVIARFNPKAKNRIFLCAHWDTRPRAEEDKDAAKRKLPIPGANDGGSGTGILLEIARILKSNHLKYGVDLILFDGEDYGEQSDLDNFCLGAKYFASTLPNEYRPSFGILLDLVGDKEAQFRKEGHSMLYAPDVTNMVWQIAANIGASAFIDAQGAPIYDDHVPLNQAGLKTIDIIDIDLVGARTPNPRRNYWHSQNDNMDNIGRETLRQVGSVLVQLLYSLNFTS